MRVYTPQVNQIYAYCSTYTYVLFELFVWFVCELCAGIEWC